MKRYLLLTERTAQFHPDCLPAHFDYLAELRSQGKLELSGGFSDGSGGAYVVFADSFEEAEQIADRDPLAKTGSSRIIVKEWLAK